MFLHYPLPTIHYPLNSAISIARIIAFALFIVSWYSLDGTESWTIPAPA
jgi:hypothetical protein